MREESSKAEGRGVLLAKCSTLRLAASARAEEASHPKTAMNADTWAKVVGRKGNEEARRKAKQEAQQKAPPREQQPRKQQSVPKGRRKGVGISVKPPRIAAVSLTVAPGSGKRCEDALARGKIRLQDIGVSDVRIRYTVAGGFLI